MNAFNGADRSLMRLSRDGPKLDLRLFCFPWAGAGASSYWPLAHLLNRRIEVLAFQPPGRENRLSIPPAHDMASLCEQFLNAADGWLERPFLLFGHSFGAMLASVIAGALVETANRQPVALVVSGCAGPGSVPRHADIGHLADDAFLSACADFGGFTEEAMQEAELMHLILPVLRSDFLAAESWRREQLPRTRASLPCEVVAIAGENDPFVSPQELANWSLVAGNGFVSHLVPGGHFYLAENPQLAADVILQLAERHTAGW